MKWPGTSMADLVVAAIVLLLAFLPAAGASAATTWYVDDDGPADFATIQAAIDAASDGDTIIVRDGTYTGSGNRDIRFDDKAVHLRSENGPGTCVINCQGTETEAHRGFVFDGGEGQSSILDGFTITNGDGYGYGGAIYCSSSPAITNNIISGNRAGYYGGGIYCSSSPTITNNTISDNVAIHYSGGGIFCYTSFAVIEGNAITGNEADEGGGIDCYDSSPTITNNAILANTTIYYGGGGVRCFDNSSAVITHNTITGNTGDNGAGMLCVGSSSPTITNNAIAENTASQNGGGIYCGSSSPSITNNTITENTAIGYGNGIYCSDGSSPTLSNSILWDNPGGAGYQGHVDPSSTLNVDYSNIEGAQGGIHVEEGGALGWGGNNVNTDPLFADPGNDDYHLKSKHGRWDPSANGGAGGWANDDVNSFCIDRADPGSPYSAEPQPNYGRVNMGAYGNTSEASKSGWNIPCDVTGDCKVDILDMLAVRDHLYQSAATDDNWRYDPTRDGMVNILDLIATRNALGTVCK